MFQAAALNILCLCFSALWSYLTSAPNSPFIYSIYGNEYRFFLPGKEHLKICKCMEAQENVSEWNKQPNSFEKVVF